MAKMSKNLPPPEFGIFFGLRSQIRQDSEDERRLLFSDFLDQHRLIKLTYLLLQYCPIFLKSRLAYLYAMSLGAQKLALEKNAVIAFYTRNNEKNKFQELKEILGEDSFVTLQIVNQPIFSFFYFLRGAFRNLPKAWQIFRIVRGLVKKHDFYIALRASHSLFQTIFFLPKFRSQRPKYVLFSTSGNPHGTAIMASRVRLGIPVLFASHGVVSVPPTKIICDIGLFHGPRILQDYQSQNSYVGNFCFYPKQETSNHSSEKDKILISLSKTFSISALKDLTEELKRQFPKNKILIRPHPQSLSPLTLLQEIPGLSISQAALSREDLQGCEFMVAGNSTVHLEALEMRVPSLYFQELEASSGRVPDFLELVPRIASLKEIRASLQEAKTNFSQELWQSRFSQYIFAEKSPAEFKLQLQKAMLEVSSPKNLASFVSHPNRKK